MSTRSTDDDMGRLTALCQASVRRDVFLPAAVELLRELAAAQGAVVLRRRADRVDLVAAAGVTSEAELAGDRLQHPLPGGTDVLVLAWDERHAAGESELVALTLVDATLARIQAQDDLADLRMRVDSAQHLANMGDYDWHIATDTNRWSDQLYRIYGHEPQSFNASYERFLSQIHPDDREKITSIHQHAYQTGEPYEMVERIVRPDGSVRYLASNGEVIMDESGTPVRMRGTCVDITERVMAEQAREHTAELTASLHDVQLRRKQALEINDNVVQGLTAASYSLRHGDQMMATAYLDHTLHAARRMMNDWLDPLEGTDLQPGDLVRENPSDLGVEGPQLPIERAEQVEADRTRILIVDDSPMIRQLLRAQLEPVGRYEIVGEAADGQA
ncbi:MAG TPA: PAS domain-containing protein, partial [Jatrophihabitantaceae bacterium]|nr:PAS domain-containing protein [Jatrophihabitantaceae bacterium]